VNAPQLTVSIETLDDVAFEAEASPVALLQTKHQLYRRAALTDSCVDLWKTLGIWATQIAADPTWLTRQRLMLITTAVPSEGTAASCLGLNVRDERQARDRLVAAIANSKSASNQQHYAAFTLLSDEGQIALLRAVDIIGNSPNLHELGDALLHEIRLAAPAAQRQAALQRLEGWWYGRVAAALSDHSRRAIAIAELESCLDDIREAFKAENLPSDFASALPPDATATEYDRRVGWHPDYVSLCRESAPDSEQAKKKEQEPT
jgi:hypothetical protein